MTILVTGGSGFIGGHLVNKLVENGCDVRIFDINKPQQEDVEWVKGDLLSQEDLLNACRDVEVVYHLAAVADVYTAIQNPELTLKVNELGTINLLKACTAKEVERVILASTTWVYGRAEGIVTEETPIPPPDHIYTKTKIGQEQLLITWQKHYDLPYTILRYDIPYGPGMRSNMAIAIFDRKAMRKEPITIFGDGSQGRCWIYVEDLAEGNVKAMTPQAKNQVINLAGEEFVTINQIVEQLKQHFGEIPVEHKPPRPGDFKGVIVKIDKAKQLLNWQPKTKFTQGLAKYIEHVKKQSQ